MILQESCYSKYKTLSEQGKINTDITGFLHNVSSTKKSSNFNYFDVVIRTADDTTVRAICLALKKHDDLEARSLACSPVKLSNFRTEEE